MTDREYPVRPIVGVGAVVVDGGRVLLVRRANEPLKGEWSLPGGAVDAGESLRAAVVREVREETGVETEMIARIDRVEYWYYWKEDCQRVRYHKFVYFYLLRYRSGDPRDHDHEVNESRWVDIDDAIKMLAFGSEKEIVRRAKELIGR